MQNITMSSSGSHLSRVRERTRDMCTPKPLCTPAHSSQITVPKDTDAHSPSENKKKVRE